MDRWEELYKSIKELRESIRELREAQKQTEKKLEESHRRTEEEIRQTQAEIREFKEAQREAHREIDMMIKENQKGIAELRESQKETERFLKEVMRGIRDLRVQLGDLGLVQGEIGEELFYRNLKSVFKKRGIVFNRVRRNLRRRRDDPEYDIVATNGRQVLVVEVKNKLKKRHIDNFLEDQLPEFKRLFPEYKNKELLGAVGGLVVKDEVGRYAERKGLFVLTQTDEGGAAIINKEKFKPTVFG